MRASLTREWAENKKATCSGGRCLNFWDSGTFDLSVSLGFSPNTNNQVPNTENLANC
jgi:hypothetical protein